VSAGGGGAETGSTGGGWTTGCDAGAPLHPLAAIVHQSRTMTPPADTQVVSLLRVNFFKEQVP
jgi:hypothetical protein